jgi:hypothetical protein
VPHNRIIHYFYWFWYNKKFSLEIIRKIRNTFPSSIVMIAEAGKLYLVKIGLKELKPGKFYSDR